MGSIVEVVGVLGIDPALGPLNYNENSEDLDTAAERKVHCPPPSLVPRLHAITIRCLQHSNPLLPHDLPFPVQVDVIPRFFPLETTPGDLDQCRAVLLELLTQVLLGDCLAAEYILLHLLSSVYGRMEFMALGKYSLNLFRFPGHATVESLHQLLQNLLTKCFLLPMTLDNMNSWRFTPKKDYDSNRLLAAVLQLSAGTEVLVDETVLTAGQLTSVGVANLTALGNVIQWQKLGYDFQFHTTEFECDLPVLVLSEGKSILKVDCHVPLVCNAETVVPSPPAAFLPHLRQYLTLCRGLDYSLGNDMKKKLEEEFVKIRSTNSQFNDQEFHHLLSTARLVSLSHGSSTLTPQLWQHTQQLETQRQQRLDNSKT